MSFEKSHIAVLCNPLAGVGRSIPLTENVCRLLKTHNIRCDSFIEAWPSDLIGFTDIWLIGGDGTLHRFINQYPEDRHPLGLIDGGTGNDFHWHLYGNLPLEDLLTRILTSEPRPIDLGVCNGERFVNGLGIGFEGAVAKDLAGRDKRPGKTSYMAAVLRNIFRYRSKSYRIKADGQFLADRWLMIDVNNSGRTGGGFHVSPQAMPDDGVLDLMMVDAVNPFKRMRYLPVIERGRHLQLPFVHCRQVRQLEVDSDAPIHYHMDGDVYEAQSLQISVLPGILSIRY